ncbi:MAG: hypothetical protein LBK71_10000 [Verrucomicrobiales bacterium]|jgi:hypothetical protein|nr:hypothetical protein [Verrucomicrobiales bacterium]
MDLPPVVNDSGRVHPLCRRVHGGSDSSGKELTVHLRHGVVTDYSVSGDEMETRMNRTGAEGGSN